MQGKPPIFASPDFCRALECLSKGTLLDLVIDLARKEIGESASELDMAELISAWARPVLIARGHKEEDIGGRLQRIAEQALRRLPFTD